MTGRGICAGVALAALAACQTTTDPAEGGFFNGVSGIASGSYDARVAEAERDVAARQARNDALAAEIRAGEKELARLKLQVLNQRNAIGRTDAQTSQRIETVLRADPGGETDAARLAALQATIADARALSRDLAELSG